MEKLMLKDLLNQAEEKLRKKSTQKKQLKIINMFGTNFIICVNCSM